MSSQDLTQWALPTYVDDDFTIAIPVGIPVFSSPIPANTDEDIFTQDFMQFRADFEPTPLNTPHDSEGQVPDYSDFFLVAEGPKQDVKGGIIKWTRTYARVPASYDEYESYGYGFIGFAGLWISGNIGNANPVVVTGRPKQTRVVTSRVRHDFFKVGPSGTYGSAGEIQTLRAQQYLTTGLTSIDTEYIQDVIGPFPATNPSRTVYNGWMANAAAKGWLSDWVGKVGAVSPGQFVAEDARISRWRGNVWLRQTRYVLAA